MRNNLIYRSWSIAFSIDVSAHKGCAENRGLFQCRIITLESSEMGTTTIALTRSKCVW